MGTGMNMSDGYWNDHSEDDPIETDDLDELGCLFGDRCLMPGEHLKKECHTVEMMEQLGRGERAIASPELVAIAVEKYEALEAIAQSARILAAGEKREPYYEAEWQRLDDAIIRWDKKVVN